MSLAFLAGMILMFASTTLYFQWHDGLAAHDWDSFTYYIHYLHRYAQLVMGAATPVGWIFISAVVIFPLVMSVVLLRQATDDDKFLVYFHGLFFVGAGLLAFLGLLLFCALRHAWTDCAEISLLLSIINLLPVLPLDGGRALNALLVGQIRFVIPVFGFLIPFSFMMTGLVLTYQKQGGSGLLMFGSWLLILTCLTGVYYNKLPIDVFSRTNMLLFFAAIVLLTMAAINTFKKPSADSVND